MPRNPDAKRRLLKVIYDLKFATIYNLSFESKGINKDSCLVGVGRHIRQLEKAGLILPVRIYGYLRNEKYRHKLEDKEYDFILEFERTRTPKAIFDEKIRLNEKITNFRKYGLSKQTKFLYVFTTENFNVTTRPVEYHEYHPMIQRVENQFGQLLRMAQRLPYYKYRFALLHQFKGFNKAVWFVPNCNKTKIIA